MGYKKEFTELNEYIYRNLELGLKEFKACAAHIELLKKYGFNITKNFTDLETAYKAFF